MEAPESMTKRKEGNKDTERKKKRSIAGNKEDNQEKERRQDAIFESERKRTIFHLLERKR